MEEEIATSKKGGYTQCSCANCIRLRGCINKNIPKSKRRKLKPTLFSFKQNQALEQRGPAILGEHIETEENASPDDKEIFEEQSDLPIYSKSALEKKLQNFAEAVMQEESSSSPIFEATKSFKGSFGLFRRDHLELDADLNCDEATAIPRPIDYKTDCALMHRLIKKIYFERKEAEIPGRTTGEEELIQQLATLKEDIGEHKVFLLMMYNLNNNIKKSKMRLYEELYKLKILILLNEKNMDILLKNKRRIKRRHSADSDHESQLPYADLECEIVQCEKVRSNSFHCKAYHTKKKTDLLPKESVGETIATEYVEEAVVSTASNESKPKGNNFFLYPYHDAQEPYIKFLQFFVEEYQEFRKCSTYLEMLYFDVYKATSFGKSAKEGSIFATLYYQQIFKDDLIYRLIQAAKRGLKEENDSELYTRLNDSCVDIAIIEQEMKIHLVNLSIQDIIKETMLLFTSKEKEFRREKMERCFPQFAPRKMQMPDKGAPFKKQGSPGKEILPMYKLSIEEQMRIIDNCGVQKRKVEQEEQPKANLKKKKGGKRKKNKKEQKQKEPAKTEYPKEEYHGILKEPKKIGNQILLVPKIAMEKYKEMREELRETNKRIEVMLDKYKTYSLDISSK